MGLLSDVEEFFGVKDFYAIFSVSKSANKKELKKAYYNLALKVHPDKADEEDKSIANQKFQVLSKVFYILCDEEKRKIYDESGDIDEDYLSDEDGLSQKRDWAAYFDMIFPKVTLSQLDEYQNKYIGSEEEISQLKELYLKYEGDLNQLSNNMTYYNIDNEERYKELINTMIMNEEVPAFDAFVKESKISASRRKRKLQNEAQEAEKMLKSQEKITGSSSLEQAIAKRQRDRESSFDSLISNLEAKYAPKKKSKGKRKT